RPAAEKWTPFRNSLSGETGEFYFGTFGENSSGIDNRGQIRTEPHSGHQQRLGRAGGAAF
ncbi:hypothetical protein, partial [Mesorhizobium sp. M0678]|uniref:hypothetical protein n=1 Tax=Mesorhizobium sp. M0678 TaxID=2956985 RepID=UPI003336551A